MTDCLLCQREIREELTVEELFSLSKYDKRWFCASCLRTETFLDECHQRYLIDKDERFKWGFSQYYADAFKQLKGHLVLSYPFEQPNVNEVLLVDVTADILKTRDVTSYAIKRCALMRTLHLTDIKPCDRRFKKVVLVDYNGVPKDVLVELDEVFTQNIERITLWKDCYGNSESEIR